MSRPSPRHARPLVAREGWPFIAACLSLAALAAGRSERLAYGPLAVAGLLAFFFRDPERAIPADPALLYAPADGRVVRIERVEAPELGGPAWRIAIFLSLFDVHINRSPAAGIVRRVEYRPGRFQTAWEPGVEGRNERNTISIDTPGGPILVLQIAGLVARRIVCYPRPGTAVRSGDRIGLIKFSSRTDLLIPAGLAQPIVPLGQRVFAGVTPIAAWGAR